MNEIKKESQQDEKLLELQKKDLEKEIKNCLDCNKVCRHGTYEHPKWSDSFCYEHSKWGNGFCQKHLKKYRTW